MGEQRAGRVGPGPEPGGLRGAGSVERVAVSWTVAGAILAGGFWPVLLTWTDGLGSSVLLETSLRLFLGGALFGFLHGVVLAWLARDRSASRSLPQTATAAALWAAMACLVAWTPAFWIALSEPVWGQGSAGARLGVGTGWLLGSAALAWAAAEGLGALARIYERWPERGPGSVLIAGTFSVLVLLLLAAPLTLPGSETPLGAAGAVLVAGGVTVWVAAPLVALALHRISGPGAR